MNTLLLVDIQTDFLPGGALAVPGGDQIIPTVNRLQRAFPVVVATQDWHPQDHGSFAANHPGKKAYDQVELDGLPQILWPVHCVQHTAGAELASALDRSRIEQVFPKGTDPRIDSYSGFFDNGHRKATGLGDWLSSRKLKDLYICGLATDYCVKFTALDALTLGFNVFLVEDACRGVNLRPHDSAEAIAEMKSKGATVLSSPEILTRGGDSI